MQNAHTRTLITEKIAGHQDRIKSSRRQSFIECLNIQCTTEAKEGEQSTGQNSENEGEVDEGEERTFEPAFDFDN